RRLGLSRCGRHARALVSLAAAIAFSGCAREASVEPSAERAGAANAAIATGSPTIASIGGVTNSAAGISNGLAAMDCGKAYNGARVINDKTGVYQWRVDGKNFGASAGSATIAGIT